MAGICALTVFGAMIFYTVPVEMSYLLDDLGVEAPLSVEIILPGPPVA